MEQIPAVKRERHDQKHHQVLVPCAATKNGHRLLTDTQAPAKVADVVVLSVRTRQNLRLKTQRKLLNREGK
jgi:hypothetical protein